MLAKEFRLQQLLKPAAEVVWISAPWNHILNIICSAWLYNNECCAKKHQNHTEDHRWVRWAKAVYAVEPTPRFSAMEGGPDVAPVPGSGPIPGEAPPFLWVLIITAAVLWWLWPWLERCLTETSWVVTCDLTCTTKVGRSQDVQHHHHHLFKIEQRWWKWWHMQTLGEHCYEVWESFRKTEPTDSKRCHYRNACSVSTITSWFWQSVWTSRTDDGPVWTSL